VFVSSATGFAMYDDGNTGQRRDKGGWVKAMLFIEGDGIINRCYNSTKTGGAATTPPCGFNVHDSNDRIGFYVIDFGFRVNDRFYSITDTDGRSPLWCTTRCAANDSPNFLGVFNSQHISDGYMIIVY